MKSLPSKQVLWSLLDYDPDSGELTWKPRDEPTFDKVFAHTPALNHIDDQGYRVGKIYGVAYKAHRVIWVMMTGKEPVGVDHEDGDPSNNRWKNLREASQTENMKNLKIYVNNESGVVGVRWNKRSARWKAYINHQGKIHNLGSFHDKDDAIAARKTAEQTYGYHRNHGRK